jgi:hypothetical protein
MAITQCVPHSSHEISGECKCVTTKVIMPVAVTAVSNCSTSVRMLVYSSQNGSSREKNGRAVFLKWENHERMVISRVGI